MLYGKGVLPLRGADSWGSGAYGAPRGSRKHKGIDYAASPGTVLESNVAGRVTKLGYPYGDDLSFRYVEVTSEDGYRHRFFYVYPRVGRGDVVAAGDVLGVVQDSTGRYEGITNHVHYEILKPGSKASVDPDKYHVAA